MTKRRIGLALLLALLATGAAVAVAQNGTPRRDVQVGTPGDDVRRGLGGNDVFVSLFLVFNVFAVGQLREYRRVGRWRSNVFGATGYIVLSLTAKSALAWQIFAGTLQ